MRSVLLAFIFTGSSLLRAAVPAPEALFPAGGRVGTTVSLRVEGKLDPFIDGLTTFYNAERLKQQAEDDLTNSPGPGRKAS